MSYLSKEGLLFFWSELKVLLSNKADSNHTHTEYLSGSGGTLTGKLIAQNNTDYTVKQVRNIYLSTAAPTSTDGSNGDIWITYTS